MTSDFLKNARIKCKMALAEKCSNKALSLYVNWRDKNGKKKIDINYKDNANEYNLHCLKPMQSFFLSDLSEPELSVLKTALAVFDRNNKTKFVAFRIRGTKDAELTRLQ
jgi:hypothetical protein